VAGDDGEVIKQQMISTGCCKKGIKCKSGASVSASNICFLMDVRVSSFVVMQVSERTSYLKLGSSSSKTGMTDDDSDSDYN
jgi:hypothetical protein